jgi:hypothetical protein
MQRSLNKTNHQWKVVLIILLGAGSLLFLISAARTLPLFWSKGWLCDFAAYYTAFKLFVNGDNPYNLVKQNELAGHLGLALENVELNFLYPPWMLVFLAPVLWWDYATAASLWLFSNIVFLTISGVAVWKVANGGKLNPFYIGAATAGFIPALHVFHFGQMGIFLAVSLSLFLWAAKSRKDWLAGVFLLALATKPQIVYLALFTIGWWILRERRYRIIISCAAAFVILAAILELRNPSIFMEWCNSWQFSFAHSQTHMGCTVVDKIREIILARTGEVAAWPGTVIPGACLFFLAAFLFLVKPAGPLEFLLPPALCLSAFTAPRIWFHDQAVLLPIQVLLVGRACRSEVSPRTRRSLLLPLILLQLVVLVLGQLVYRGQDEYFWFPILLLTIWRVSVVRLGEYSGIRRFDQ